METLQWGLGAPAVRTIVVLGDGAYWIWERAHAFLRVPGVEVVEIVDIFQGYGYLWAVGNAFSGTGDVRAAAWVEPLKDQVYAQGVALAVPGGGGLPSTGSTTASALALMPVP